MMELLVVGLVAIVSGVASTYLARLVALRVGLVDKPDGRRKIHAKPVAVAGGLGVFVGTLVTLGVAAALFPTVAEAIAGRTYHALAFLAAASVIAVVGLIDDLVNLRARYKLAGQVVAAIILIGPGGLVVDEVGLFGVSVPLGYLAAPLTILWLLATMNALNLLDGMDGFLGTVGLIAFAALATMSFAADKPFAGWVTLAMAGSIIGFLRFNLPPASVYLGDCGSLLIGLMVGAAGLEAALKGPTTAIVGPICLLVLPMLDTTAAVVRRKLTGRGLAIGDRGHLHHILKANGLSSRRVLALVAVLGGLAAGGALVATYHQNDVFAVVAAVAVVMILLAGGLFGNAEFRLLRERATNVVKKATGSRHHIELEVRLQGSADWQQVWQEVTRAAEEVNLQTVCLDVNAPAWHEGYHRRWDRVGRPQAEFTLWKVELPLFGHGQAIGRLTVVGVRDEVPIAEKMRIVSEIVDAAETRAAEITRSSVVPSSAQVSPKPPTMPVAASA